MPNWPRGRRYLFSVSAPLYTYLLARCRGVSFS
jgi:hypothetical protein